MAYNPMEQYIKNVKSFLKDFSKLFLQEKYNEKISNGYIDTYVDARICNFTQGNHIFFYKRIYESLIVKKDEMKKEFEKIDDEVLKTNLKLYDYILYLDGIRQITNEDEFYKNLIEERTTKLNLSTTRNIETKFRKLVKDYNEKKEKILEMYDTKDFSLNIKKYTLIDNTYKANLDYNFKIPYIYSKKVIEEVYNEGNINEDKLLIEYTLLVVECIKQINNADFETRYIVDFASSLFEKGKKIKQYLKALDNVAIQDKIIFKIHNKEFLENKELIYSLMKDGFKFAIIINDDFKYSDTAVKKLEIFKFILVPEESKHYEKFKENENKISNTIIFDT